MKVIDYKDNCFFTILQQKARFKRLEKKLKRCSSFKEQMVVLRDFYKAATFTRDALLARYYILNNKKTFGLKETLLSYKDLIIALSASLFTLCFEDMLSFNVNLPAMLPQIILVSFLFASVIVMCCLSAWLDKTNYIRKEIPLQEIFDYELKIVEKTLAVEWHPTKNSNLKPEQVTPRSNKKVWWIGKCGHEWQATGASRNKGVGCRKCRAARKRK